jgi:hypothetical protein
LRKSEPTIETILKIATDESIGNVELCKVDKVNCIRYVGYGSLMKRWKEEIFRSQSEECLDTRENVTLLRELV